MGSFWVIPEAILSLLLVGAFTAPDVTSSNNSNIPDAQSVALTWLESSVLDAINQRRTEAGLSPLMVDPILTWVARQRSGDMATNGYFSHTAPDGFNYISLLGSRGIVSGVVGEILGRNNAADDLTTSMVAQAFMNSPSHRLHIVYPDYQQIGVGVAVGGGNMKYFAIIFRGL